MLRMNFPKPIPLSESRQEKRFSELSVMLFPSGTSRQQFGGSLRDAGIQPTLSQVGLPKFPFFICPTRCAIQTRIAQREPLKIRAFCALPSQRRDMGKTEA